MAPAEIVLFNFFGDPAGARAILASPDSVVNPWVDVVRNALFLYDLPTDELIAIKLGDDDLTAIGQVVNLDAADFGVVSAQGMTFDATAGRLFFLDKAASRIVQVDREPRQGSGNGTAPGVGRTTEITVQDDLLADLQGLAFNPSDGHLYVMDAKGRWLYKLSESGRIVTAFELSEVALQHPQELLFAPSGDLTDDPDRMSLYVADSTVDGHGKIVELAFAEPVRRPVLNQPLDATLVRTINTSQFDPPSPDPSGLAYISDEIRLEISDAEVEEMPIFEGVNVFEIDLLGNLSGTFNATEFSDEPTGAAYKPDGKRIIFADDSKDEIYELGAGGDGQYGTADDILTSFDTRAFDSHDPEGIAYEGTQNRVFVVDGVNAEVYEVTPGPNGVLDGVDDVVYQFDTEALGVLDPEGIEFNPDRGTLYLVGEPEDIVAEVTTSGELVSLIDIAEADPRSPSGLAYGRRSDNPDFMSLYVVDRRVDNDTDPKENDGQLYEFGLDIVASAPTPTPTAAPSTTHVIYVVLIQGGAKSEELAGSDTQGR